jgi:hypothetical protein
VAAIATIVNHALQQNIIRRKSTATACSTPQHLRGKRASRVPARAPRRGGLAFNLNGMK